MSILPTFLTQEDIPDNAVSAIRKRPKEYGMNFTTGQLTGEIVEDLEAIKVWVWCCLHSERYRYPIYSWQYGVEYEQYFGETLTADYLNGDCKTETEEALKVNPWIIGVTNFSAEMEGSRLHISFTLETDFGEAEVDEYV